MTSLRKNIIDILMKMFCEHTKFPQSLAILLVLMEESNIL